ncbi:Uncharacterized protein SCF082_LOCUS20436 [Durusdinium trenchii]|uniref:Uncharacterized protein n=1 Tax=Durusdinium trenchii TaxID=1381693 RepID=A0ABP0L4Z0_9DINO
MVEALDGDKVKQKQKKNKICVELDESEDWPTEKDIQDTVVEEDKSSSVDGRRPKENWQPKLTWKDSDALRNSRGSGGTVTVERQQSQPSAAKSYSSYSSSHGSSYGNYCSYSSYDTNSTTEKSGWTWNRDDWDTGNSGNWRSSGWWERIDEKRTSEGEFDGAISVKKAGWISFCNRSLDQEGVRRFCDWLPSYMRKLQQSGQPLQFRQNCILARVVDVSCNNLDCSALRMLLCSLKDQRIVMGSLKLHGNRIRKAGAEMLGMWIRTAPMALYELHLSHNRICTEGALSIVESIAKTARYPSDRPNNGDACVPLWLRMEHNDIEASFVQNAEWIFKKHRPNFTGPYICWLSPTTNYSSMQCRSDCCALANSYQCPVVHMPYLRKNMKEVQAPQQRWQVRVLPVTTPNPQELIWPGRDRATEGCRGRTLVIEAADTWRGADVPDTKEEVAQSNQERREATEASPETETFQREESVEAADTWRGADVPDTKEEVAASNQERREDPEAPEADTPQREERVEAAEGCPAEKEIAEEKEEVTEQPKETDVAPVRQEREEPPVPEEIDF